MNNRTPTPEILARIEAAPSEEDRPRKYLGASSIGEECSRKLWYQFRHVAFEKFSPRLKRLFAVGDREEEVFTTALRAAGMTVWDRDPRTGEQFAISDFEGHFKGHADGGGQFPEEDAVLLEYKTYNDKRFENLRKYGVQRSDPKYYAQTQVYMHYLELASCLFCAVNKNTSELFFEYVELDPAEFRKLNQKAHDILHADRPPVQIGTEESYSCRYCFLKDICHNGAEVLKNCRSCRFGEPAENATWICRKGKEWGAVCELWEDITKPTPT